MTSFVGIDVTQTYSAAALTGANSGKVPKVGDLYESYDNKTYRFVKYNQGAGAIAAVANNVVGFYAPGGTSTGVFNEVTSDVSDTAGLGAGVLAGAPGNGEYGWIQVSGPATLNTALVSGASGQPLVLSSTTDGTLKVAGALTDSVVAYAILAASKIVMCSFPR